MAPTIHTWRISDPAALSAGDQTTLATGLRYHLAVASLHSALVQVGGRQQAYLSLAGCPGCATDRCDMGCRTDLLRRVLRAAGGQAGHLERVAEGLTTQGYRAFLWAWPAQPEADPIDGSLLAGWPRARLVAQWRKMGRQRLQVSALIALGGDADGPPLAPRLAAQGWGAQPVPALLRSGAADPRWPLAHLRGGVWNQAPWIALPAARTAEVPA
ncbi:hypothetical protein K2Z83_25855 [Oscillochloris sp. ZM17-4]|uniref:hypothetical protein n=1 Tax=Oscillochloris sp. ZM17-4 TaxID=2866714 RepID=UPI001C73B08C|nr:hypothetical protein [Oscillochloris sp. ZM17-4]MBX0331081.1 hypothetical protein [Oscillochloris sp. ZM17-4]